MEFSQHRFRDSGPLRWGFGVIALVVLLIACGAIVAFGFGHDFAVGASVMWAALWLLLGIGLVIVGIGQTIVRRRRFRRRD